MTLYDLIFKAGGFIDEEFKKRAYLKRAELVRIVDNNNEKKIIPFDLGLALEKKGKANMKLQVDDAINVYSINEIEGDTRYVSISGHVKRPGTYELFESNMRIHDLLFKAGGFDDPLFKTQTFLTQADLVRFEKDRITQSIISFDLGGVLSDTSNEQNILLLPGDEIRVYPETIFNYKDNITITGVVKKPGTYNLKKDMTLKDLLMEAGGFQDNVFRCRVEIARIDPLNQSLNKYAETINFSLDSQFINPKSEDSTYKSSTENYDYILMPYDFISIRPDPYFSKQKQITVSGVVMYPGKYIILSSDEKITDIVRRAGGLLPNAYPEASQYKRKGLNINISLDKIIKNSKSKLNFEVQDGDELIIVPHPNVIMISGEVNTSGIHKYVPNKRLRYYLNLSGGLTPDADVSNIWVEYPNGDSKKFNKWSLFSPKVIDGTSIVVGKQKEEEPFDRTEYAKEITQIIANLAQALAVVVLARQ